MQRALGEDRTCLGTTNGNEGVNWEPKRRSRMVWIFPNRASCLRLATALLKEWMRTGLPVAAICAWTHWPNGTPSPRAKPNECWGKPPDRAGSSCLRHSAG